MDEVDPELVKTFNKLGISLEEQKRLAGVAVDAVLDSVSVKTTHRERLAELGVIFCSFSGGCEGLSRTGAEISRHGGRLPRQFLRCAELGGEVLRRLVRLHTKGSALSHGA